MTRALVLVLLVASVPVQAQRPEDVAAARALFDEGVRLVAAGQLAAAAERFRRSIELHPAASARFNLAVVESDMGHLVTASELLQQLATDPSAPADVRTESAQRAQALQRQLARLTVQFQGHPEGASLRIDQRLLPPAAIGVAVPVDPGHHRVEAVRGSSAVAGTDVDLGASQARSLVLDVPLGGGTSIFEEWWFWTIVGAVLVAGGAVAIGVGVAVSSDTGPAQPTILGNVPPGWLVVP